MSDSYGSDPQQQGVQGDGGREGSRGEGGRGGNAEADHPVETEKVVVSASA